MFQTVIAVLIGMSFLYFILAVLCSGIKEFIAAKLDMRATTLEQGIGRMLANNASSANQASANQSPANQAPGDSKQTSPANSLVTAFYDHPLIKGLGDENRKPSYVPAKYFSTVLEQVLRASHAGSNYRDLIGKLPPGDLKDKLAALVDRAGEDTQAIRKEIEDWFDSTMDRVSGWYKRKAQKIVLAIAFVLVIALNADSFAVFRALWQNSALRDKVVAAATNAKSDMKPEEAKQQLSDLEQIKELPVGWKSGFSLEKLESAFTNNLWWWFLKIFGWAITAFAATLGAPFWFDAMNKLVNVRLTGSPPQAAPAQAAPASTVVIQTEGTRTLAAKAP